MKEKEKIEYYNFGDGTRGIIVPDDVFEFKNESKEQKINPTFPIQSIEFEIFNPFLKSVKDLQNDKEIENHQNIIKELKEIWGKMGIPVFEFEIDENGKLKKVENDANEK